MSGKQTTTQASTSEPWKPAQPALQTGLTDAQNLYKAGIGGQVNTQSNVVPFAQQTTQAMNAGQNMANQNIGGQGLSGQYQGIINNGGFNSQQQEALGGIRNTANASFDPMNQAGFGSVLKQAQDAAGGAVNQQASGMGRLAALHIRASLPSRSAMSPATCSITSGTISTLASQQRKTSYSTQARPAWATSARHIRVCKPRWIRSARSAHLMRIWRDGRLRIAIGSSTRRTTCLGISLRGLTA